MTEIKKKITINAEEMECLTLKYMKKHNVKKREAKRIIFANGFNNNKTLKDSMK